MTHSPLDADQAVAIAEIERILHRYALLARENADIDAIVDLFTENGVFILPDGTKVPAASIAAIVGDRPPVFIRHHVTTTVIDLSGDADASATTYFIAYTHLSQPDHWGYWQDTFRRVDDGRWLLTSKQPFVEGYAPDGDWAQMPWNASE